MSTLDALEAAARAQGDNHPCGQPCDECNHEIARLIEGSAFDRPFSPIMQRYIIAVVSAAPALLALARTAQDAVANPGFCIGAGNCGHCARCKLRAAVDALEKA